MKVFVFFKVIFKVRVFVIVVYDSIGFFKFIEKRGNVVVS